MGYWVLGLCGFALLGGYWISWGHCEGLGHGLCEMSSLKTYLLCILGDRTIKRVILPKRFF
jgi:hypothetical protein